MFIPMMMYNSGEPSPDNYYCHKCKRLFEAVADSRPKHCPECGSPHIEYVPPPRLSAVWRVIYWGVIAIGAALILFSLVMAVATGFKIEPILDFVYTKILP